MTEIISYADAGWAVPTGAEPDTVAKPANEVYGVQAGPDGLEFMVAKRTSRTETQSVTGRSPGRQSG